MGIVPALLSGGIQGIGEGVAAVINAIKGRNPEDAAKLAEILGRHSDLVTQAEAALAQARVAENVSLNETAGQNIRSEAASSKYAADARPSVIYAGLIVILLNYGLLAVIPRAWGWLPVTIPDLVWEIWCVCVTGYVFARSSDKLFGGAGGSLSLPFGVKADSKGDLPK